MLPTSTIAAGTCDSRAGYEGGHLERDSRPLWRHFVTFARKRNSDAHSRRRRALFSPVDLVLAIAAEIGSQALGCISRRFFTREQRYKPIDLLQRSSSVFCQRAVFER